VAVIVFDGKAYEATAYYPLGFGDYLQTSQGLLLVDGVVHFGGGKVYDCRRASEESAAWASGLSGLMGGMRAIELTEIVPAASSPSG
jgi:hypothetical protein